MKSGTATLEVIHGQPSWRVSSRDVEACITEKGGQLGPVVFDRRGRKIQPFSIAPWAEEKLSSDQPPIIQALRGDFFCLPFGANAKPFGRERHPVHGETANAKWKFQSLETHSGKTTLRLGLDTAVRAGRVEKEITLVAGQNVVYCKHTLSGMGGPMNMGHHAMLKFPDEPGSGIISTSAFTCGQVFPGQFEDPASYGYSSLKAGAEFRTLRAVPLAAGGTTDLSQYPARRGFEDLVMIVHDLDVPLAWTAVTFPKQRYVWFSLKNPRILRETVFWISNGGRHYAPWSGRHTSVMGIEDVTSYFHYGLAESAAKNPISAKGFPTHHVLDSERPFVVPYIMGAVPVPAGFDRVTSIEPAVGKDAIILNSASGKKAHVEVQPEFLIVV